MFTWQTAHRLQFHFQLQYDRTHMYSTTDVTHHHLWTFIENITDFTRCLFYPDSYWHEKHRYINWPFACNRDKGVMNVKCLWHVEQGFLRSRTATNYPATVSRICRTAGCIHTKHLLLYHSILCLTVTLHLITTVRPGVFSVDTNGWMNTLEEEEEECSHGAGCLDR